MKSDFQKKIEKVEKSRAELIYLAIMNQESENFKNDLEAFKIHVQKSLELYKGIHFDQ